MSAIRTIDRRAARKAQSSPYARPIAPKKSWGFLGGLLSYLNPLRSKSPVEDNTSHNESEDISSASEDDVTQMLSDSQNSHDLNTHQRPNVIAEPSGSNIGHPFPNAYSAPTFAAPTTPMRPNTNSLHDPSPSSDKNLETVTAFLSQRLSGPPLNKIELAGVFAVLQKSSDKDDKPEPFRFSSSTPSTPGRGNSPSLGFTTPDASNGVASQSPRKTLSKNPNGIYRWEGGGSARPRNRIRSPAFGPSRSSSSNIKLSPPEIPKTDTKRRRVGAEAETSSSQQVPAAFRSSAPSPSRPTEVSLPFPVSNGASPIRTSPVKVDAPSTPRLRLSALPLKPTIPAIPSPLRQAWGETDSSSPPRSAPSSRPTKAANFMEELIKEVTPPKKPDVSNPYQTASPVKPTAKRPPLKRTRATGKPTIPPPQQKAPEPSPQAIIEATIPKGSKRSRPPANLEKSLNGDSSSSQKSSPAANGVNGSSHLPKNDGKSPLVEEVSDEDGRAPKKQRLANGTSLQPIVVEDPDIIEVVPSSTPTTSGPAAASDIDNTKPLLTNGFVPSSGGVSPTGSRSMFGGKSSAPKEPSKLRFSYQPDASISSSSASTPTPTPQSPQPVQPSLEIGKEKENAVKLKLDPKDAALAMDVDALPSFSFVFRETSNLVGSNDVACKAAKEAPVSSLPTFDFSMTLKSKETSGATMEVKAPSAAPVAFNWAAAGMAAPSKPASASWTCSTCMLSNPATATSKCTVCDSPR